MFFNNKFFVLSFVYLTVYVLLLTLHYLFDILPDASDSLIKYLLVYGYLNACSGYFMFQPFDSSEITSKTTACFSRCWGCCFRDRNRDRSSSSLGQSLYSEVEPVLDVDSESGMA